MTYVVTQPCCADASCVVACPVNCIHPAPGEPGFATAEMVYIDAGSCVGCGACATACPVEAIKPDTSLTAQERPFLQINADYYDCFPHRDRAPVAVVARQRRLTRRGPFRVAVVGAGPAGLYVADELLTHPEVGVDVYDRLPTPYGLVRAGVAPDHQHTKRVEKLFRAIEEQPGFRYFLGVEVGVDLTLADLEAQYDAVVYSVGASADKVLGIPGEDFPGSLSATHVVGWYNGHPDKQDLIVDLSARGAGERVVVVGNGNVALDVARIMTADPAQLEHTDIAALAWTALTTSVVREVVVLGRRGPAEAAFTVPELVGLVGLSDAGVIDVVVDTGGAPITDTAGVGRKVALIADLATRAPRDGLRRIVLRFDTRPTRFVGNDRVRGLEVERDGVCEVIETGLVLRAIGYRGRPVADLPHDEARGIVPNDRGRVRPGLYVAGWVKRGPTGFIGSNKACAQETVTRILDDLDAGLPTPVGTRESIAAVVTGRCPDVIGLDGWRAIDAEERHRGAVRGRPRTKIVDVEEMVLVAQAPATSTSARRYASLRSRIRGPEKRG